jgi:hypothetical protein
VLIVVGALAAIAIPPLVSDAGEFAHRLPELVDRLRSRIHSIPVLRNNLQHLPGGMPEKAGAVAIGVGGLWPISSLSFS